MQKMTTFREKRRARRIAADEAHAWARNLRLRNPLAKLVLCMLTQYVNGDGVCFVSIDELGKDCELAPNTIRSRLTWLEEMGVIARRQQWLDEKGRRNADGIGRRTTDDIRLLIETDNEVLDQRIAGENQPESAEISPSPGEGLNAGPDITRPSPALQQPFTCVQGLTSEPEPESPPTPSGGERESVEVLEEPEDFGPAWSSWPGHEVMRRDLALAEFRELPPDKQRHCRAAIALFVKMQAQLGRKHPPNFHLWIRNRGFEEFPTAANADPDAGSASPTSFDVGSAEGRAIRAVFAVARTPLFEHRGRVVYPLPVTAQVLAFAQAGNSAGWQWIEDRNQIAAWQAFLSAHVHKPRPSLVMTRGSGDQARQGIYAPWPWPPRKDGSLSSSGEAA